MNNLQSYKFIFPFETSKFCVNKWNIQMQLKQLLHTTKLKRSLRLEGTIARTKKPLKKPTQLLVNIEQKGHPYNYTLGKKSANLHLPLHSQEACFLIMKNMNIIKLLILSMVFLIYFQSSALSYMYVLKNIKRLS